MPLVSRPPRRTLRRAALAGSTVPSARSHDSDVIGIGRHSESCALMWSAQAKSPFNEPFQTALRNLSRTCLAAQRSESACHAVTMGQRRVVSILAVETWLDTAACGIEQKEQNAYHGERPASACTLQCCSVATQVQTLFAIISGHSSRCPTLHHEPLHSLQQIWIDRPLCKTL